MAFRDRQRRTHGRLRHLGWGAPLAMQSCGPPLPLRRPPAPCVRRGQASARLTGTDGKILWDYDTAHEYQTVNGVPGHGGAMDVAGPVVAGGMLFVVSGYPARGGLPGNVLLAFGLDSEAGK